MSKKCSKCGFEKPRFDFNILTAAKDGLQNYCRVCSSEVFKGWVKASEISVSEGNKFCKTCSKEQPISNFSKNKDGKLGVHSVCKPCLSDKSRVRRCQKDYREYLKKSAREYTLKNKDKANVKSAKRRAARNNAIPCWVAGDEFGELFLEEIYNLSLRREKETGFKWQVDHSVPLQSVHVCGLHWYANLRLIPAAENKTKGNRYWPDMW